MRLLPTMITGFALVGMTGLAVANPAMLPKHPGYPSGGEFANDTGQQNLTYSQSLMEAATSGDTNMTPTLRDQDNANQSKGRLSEQGGAGQASSAGPNGKTAPSEKKPSQMNK
jgi:hypothetical protein